VFDDAGSTNTGTITLQGTLPGTATYQLPNLSGTQVICTSNATSCSTVYAAAGSYLLQNPVANDTSTSNFAGYQYSFTQSNTGAGGNLSLTNAGSGDALAVTASSNPSASTNALVVVNNTNGTPSGNLIDLQNNGSNELSVDYNGNITQNGGTSTTDTINGQTISAATNFTGTVTATGLITGDAGLTVTGGTASLNASSNNGTNINTGSSTGAVAIGNTGDTGGVAINADAASNFTTATGVLTLQGASGITVNASSAGGNVTLNPDTTGVVVVGTSSTTLPTLAFSNANTGGTIDFQNASSGVGNTLNVTGQTGAAASNGGQVIVQGGAAGTTGTGGLLTLEGGAASATAGSVSGGVTLASQAGAAGSGATSGGAAGVILLQGGAGGAGTGTNSVGAAGAGVTLTAGNGGASTGTAADSNGGAILLQGGSAGSGGSGSAGTAGGVTVKDASNNTAAFQVQNTGSEPLFIVDTTTNNLVTNPGFENGVAGWTSFGSGTGLARTQNTTKADTYNSQASLLVTTASGTANSGVQVTQGSSGFTATIATGTQYTLSFYVMGGSTNGTFSTLGVSLTGGSASCTTGTISVVTTGFKRYSCSFTPSGSNVSGIVWSVSDTTQHTFYLDGVQLVASGSVTPYNIGNEQLRGVVSNPVVLQGDSNSQTAFQIQNAAGTDNLLVADTLDGTVGIGTSGVPGSLLSVGGTTGNTTVDGSGDIVASTSVESPDFDTASGVALAIGGTNASSVTIGRTTTTNALTLQGSASSDWLVTGASGTTTLSFAAPSGTTTLTLPTGTGTICTTVATTCSSVYEAAGSYLAKNATDTSSASVASASYLYGFTNSNSTPTTGGVLSLTNGANTGNALYVTASGNPAASTNALIVANNTAGSPSGNLLDLQKGGTNELSVDTSGDLSTLGGYTQTGSSTNTFTGASSFTGGSTSSNGLAVSNNAQFGTNSGTTLTVGINSTPNAKLNVNTGSAVAFRAYEASTYDIGQFAETGAGVGNVNTNATTTVSGGSVSPLFTQYFRVGDAILVNGQLRTVSSIASDTSMVVSSSITSGTNQSYYNGVVGPGTVTTNGTTALVGSSTTFTTTFQVGDTILINGESNPGTIASITDNTHLTLASTAATSASGLAYARSEYDRLDIKANGNVGIGTNSSTAALMIQPDGVGQTGFVIQGADGQTALLQQNQDYTGAVLSSFGTNGQLTLGRAAVSGTQQTGTIGFIDGTSGANTYTDTLNVLSLSGNHTISLPDAAGTICLTSQNCSTAGSGYILSQSSSPGTAQTGANFNIAGTGIAGTALESPIFDTASGVALAIGNTHATAINLGNTTSNIATTINGTANVQPTSGHDSTTAFTVKNSSGNAVLTVDTSGDQVVLGKSNQSGDGGKLVFNDAASSNTGTVQLGGTLSGTATYNLPNLSGTQTICTTVTSSCSSAGSGYIVNGTSTQTANYNVQSASAASVGAVIQGATSQTADLLDLRDSTGGNLLSVSSAGNEETLGYTDSPWGGSGPFENLLAASEYFDQSAYWVASGTLTVTANTTNGPDGTLSADQLAGTGSTNISQSVTTTTTGTYTFSVWLKQVSGAATTGLCIYTTGGTPSSCTATAVTPSSTDWQRFSVTTTVSGSPTAVKVEILPGNGSTATVDAWGGQLVPGSAPEVYTPTTFGNDTTANDGEVVNGEFFVEDPNGGGNVQIDQYGDFDASGLISGNDGAAFQTYSSGNPTLQVIQTGSGFTVPTAVIDGGTSPGAAADLLQLQIGGSTVARFNNAGNLLVAGSLDTQTSTGLTIGGSNAASVAVGRTGITTQVNGTTQLGGSAGTGALINNGSTTNTVDALTNFATGGSIGTAATTVDIYTSISIAQTTGGQTITIPNPTASTTYGKLLYISNIGSQPFGLLTATLNPGSTATLVWANANGGAAWTFAGADAGLQSAYNNSGTTNPQIVLSNTNGGIKIQDAASSTITNLLQVSNNGGTSNYMTVTSAASGTLGTSNITLYATSAGNGSRTISIANQTTGGQIGDTLNVIAAAGNTSGAGGALNVTAGAGGNAAGGGAVTVSGGAAGGGNNAGGAATLQGGAATGTGTGGTANVTGGAASSTAGSNGGAVAIASGAGATGSGATAGGTSGAVTVTGANGGAGSGTNSPGGSASNVTITGGTGGASTGNAVNSNGGSIFLVAGNAGTGGSGTAGTPGVVSIDSPVFTSIAASASGSSYAIPQADIDGYGSVVITESTSGGTVTVAAPTNTSTGHVIYMMASNGSLSFTLSPSGGPSVNMNADDTEMLEWNGSQWTASVSGSSLQQVYNNTTTAPASIVTTSSTKTILLQAGSGDDASNLFAVDNGLGSADLDVDTTAGVNLIQNSSFETNPLPGSGAGAWTKVGNASASVARSTTYAYVGSASLQLNTTNNSGDGVEQAITSSTGTATALTASTQYYISWYANGAGTAVPSTIAEYSYNGSSFSACTGLNITSGAIPSTAGWTRYTCTFTTGSGGTAPTTSNAVEIIQNSAPGGTRTWYIDAVQLEQNATGPTAFRETALQLNGLITSPVAIQSANNSVSALSVQNASGSSLLVADTLDGAVGINMGTQAMVNGGGDLQFGGSANRTIQVESAVATNAAGANLTINAGAANGSSTGNNGGSVAINGGAAAGTGNNTGGAVSLTGGAATGTGTGGGVTLTAGSGSSTSGSPGGQVNIDAGAGSSAGGAGAVGGDINIVAGNSSGTIAAGNIHLTAGNAGGTGVPGVVYIDTPVFTSSGTTDTFSTTQTMAASLVDNASTVVVSASAANLTLTMPSPSNNSVGRTVYITVANGSQTFTLSLGAGFPSLNMLANTTAALVWNGSGWTGGSAASSLQQVYNDTSTTPASIVTTSTTKTLLVQAGVGDDSSTLFSIDNSFGSAALDVDSTTTNLVQNSSFEANPLPSSGSAGYWTHAGTSDSVARSTAQAYVGTASLAVSATTASGDGAKQSLTNNTGTATALTASTQYYISYYVDGGSTAVTSTIAEYSYNGSSFSACTNLTPAGGAATTTGWTRYTCTFTTGSGGTAPTTSNAIEIIQNATQGATHTFYIDAVELEPVGSLSQSDAYAETNLQFNGQVVSPLSLQNASNSTTAFQIQNASGGQLLDVDTVNSLVVIGNSTNNETFGSTGEPTLAGTARHAKTIQLTAEYAGAVLDTGGQSSVTGTMTAAFDSTHDIGYYNWTTSQAMAQTYDIVARVPIPSDWSAWNGNPTFLTQANVGTTAGVSATVESISYEVNSNPTGTPTTDSTFGTYTITPSTANTWTAFSANALSSSGYAVGDTMIIRIRLSALSNDSVLMGDITIPYLSKY